MILKKRQSSKAALMEEQPLLDCFLLLSTSGISVEIECVILQSAACDFMIKL